MRNKVSAALVVGGLLVGAGLITSVVSSPGTAVAQEEPEDSESGSPIPRIVGFLGDVLDGLVGDGTITQDQADAVVAASEQKASELRQEHEAERELVEGLLEDDVITEDEAAELPDDHFLLSDRFDEAWADGELTREEIGGPRHGRGHDFRRGFRLGSLLDDGGIDQEEYDALPDDHPLKEADVSQYLEDGQITPDELRELFSSLKDAHTGGDA